MHTPNESLPANSKPPGGEETLPSIIELYDDTEMLIKRSELNVLMNQQPKPEWIKDHPHAKKEVPGADGKKKLVPVQHIPIERLQWLMRRIFGGYTTHILDYKIIANSLAVSVRIFFRDPLTGKDEYTDGIGAVPIQTKKDHGAIDFDNMNTMAVQMGLPAAKTFAEKDAIGGLGKLFGSDLNRYEETYYESHQGTVDFLELEKLKKDLSKLLGATQDEKLSDKIVDEVTTIELNGEPTKEDYQKWISQLEAKAKTKKK